MKILLLALLAQTLSSKDRALRATGRVPTKIVISSPTKIVISSAELSYHTVLSKIIPSKALVVELILLELILILLTRPRDTHIHRRQLGHGGGAWSKATFWVKLQVHFQTLNQWIIFIRMVIYHRER